MAVELVVPDAGESITQVQLGPWQVQEGQRAERDQTLLEIETDKATLEMSAPVGGVVTKILKKEGETAAVGEVIGYMEEVAAAAQPAASAPAAPAGKSASAGGAAKSATAPVSKPAAVAMPGAAGAAQAGAAKAGATRVMPAAQRELAQRGMTVSEAEPSGPGGRLLKEDVQRAAERPRTAPAAATPAASHDGLEREEEVIAMSPMRRRIAERLVQAKQDAALLTTFNEVDLSAVMALRKEHQEAFQQKYGVKLGFMSFFVKAAIEALKQIPAVNAEIRGTDIVYKNYYDVGVAVATGKGLVVPVLRSADRMSFGAVELAIADFGTRGRDNKIALDELQGGTFTISNGGIFGSLMGTPIVNPPQTAILGMHAIQDRPVAREGQVVIRPMMYLALTYDHRLIDGREAATFLMRVKACVENPARMLLEV